MKSIFTSEMHRADILDIEGDIYRERNQINEAKAKYEASLSCSSQDFPFTEETRKKLHH